MDDTRNRTGRENFDSLNLYEKFMLLEGRAAEQVADGIHWVVENGIDAVLVGGTAVVHYLSGGRTLTPDADFLCADFDAVKAKLEESNARFEDVVDVSGRVIGVTDIDRNTDFLNPAVAHGNRALNRAILATPLEAKVAGVTVKIVNPELLAILKLDLGREKDVADGFALLASGKLSRDRYDHFVDALRHSLSDGQAIAAYSDLIPDK